MRRLHLGFGVNEDQSGQAVASMSGSGLPSDLMQILMIDSLDPGAPPSYEDCKTIYSYHPLGEKMCSEPISLAQSQEREISIAVGPEADLKKAFNAEWKKIGKVGADSIIHYLMTLSRVYGVATLIAGVPEIPTNKPLDDNDIQSDDLYFNVLDPLNTAGSLILNQDPNAPDFLKPTLVMSGDHIYHASRTVIQINEKPIWLEWSNSAFGFIGRSVFQRALYPLKSYIQSMITDQAIMEKAMLLVAKMKAPGSPIDQRVREFFGFKRQAIKGAKTGNVVSIGIDEDIASIDLKNLRDAAEFARNNILKNIATAASMPASIINMETLAEGFGEGTEDAKNIARYVDRLRITMNPAYLFMSDIVMRRAWSKPFYETIQRKYPEYQGVSYKSAFLEWKNSFEAVWPNLLVEPDSEKAKSSDVKLKAAIGIFEVIAPTLDPANKARAVMWLADTANAEKDMFSTPLDLDEEAIASYEPPTGIKEPEEPEPESYRDSELARILHD